MREKGTECFTYTFVESSVLSVTASRFFCTSSDNWQHPFRTLLLLDRSVATKKKTTKPLSAFIVAITLHHQLSRTGFPARNVVQFAPCPNIF